MKKLAAAFGISAAFLAAWTLIAAAMSFAAPAGTSVAVFGLSGRALAAVAAADGRFVELGENIVIARSDAPDFIQRLYANGALLVLDARIAEGCTGRKITAVKSKPQPSS